MIDKKFYPYKFNIHPFYLPNKKPILLTDKNKEKTLKKGKKYLDKCLNFPNYHVYKYIKHPKVSVIIPLYNCEKTIMSSIHSIQNQNMTKIEILLIIFDYIYLKGKSENLDIIGFLTINVWNYNAKITKMKNIYTYQYPEELYIEQPELGIWMIKFKGNFLVHNNMIWDKCIKSSIYKKAVNVMGFQRYSKFLIWAEDASMVFVIFNLAKNFKYVYKYGILHYKSKFTASFSQSNDIRLFGEIFFLDIIYDFSSNTPKDKNLIVGQAFYIHDRYNISKFSKDRNSYYLKYVLKKIIKYKYLSKFNIRKLKNIFSSFFIY